MDNHWHNENEWESDSWKLTKVPYSFYHFLILGTWAPPVYWVWGRSAVSSFCRWLITNSLKKHYCFLTFKFTWGIFAKSLQSCLTLCSPLDCSPPGSSIHGILQARILEWVAISFSRGSSQPRNRTQVSCIAGRFFTYWAMQEAYIFIYLFIYLKEWLVMRRLVL